MSNIRTQLEEKERSLAQEGIVSCDGCKKYGAQEGHEYCVDNLDRLPPKMLCVDCFPTRDKRWVR